MDRLLEAVQLGLSIPYPLPPIHQSRAVMNRKEKGLRPRFVNDWTRSAPEPVSPTFRATQRGLVQAGRSPTGPGGH